METEPKSSLESAKQEIINPEFLQQQFNLPKEQWDEQFRALVQEKSEANQRAIRETEEAIEKGTHEAPQEILQEAPGVIRERTFERYKSGLDLDEDSLKGKRILDLGSGGGEFVEYLTQEGITQEAYGLDANVDEMPIKEELKSHLFQGDFQKELPVKNLDYIVSLGAVSNAIWGGETIQDIESIIKNSLAALKENGEIRIYPIQEATKESALDGIKESHKKWIELLNEIPKTGDVECVIQPRDIKVVGKNNDIILESVLIIKKKSER